MIWSSKKSEHAERPGSKRSWVKFWFPSVDICRIPLVFDLIPVTDSLSPSKLKDAEAPGWLVNRWVVFSLRRLEVQGALEDSSHAEAGS